MSALVATFVVDRVENLRRDALGLLTVDIGVGQRVSVGHRQFAGYTR